MRVIVTGGAGFIGSHVVDALVARGDEVVVLDDLSHGKPENVKPGAELVIGDIRDPETVNAVFGDGSVHFLNDDLEIRIFARLVTRAGGEVVAIP